MSRPARPRAVATSCCNWRLRLVFPCAIATRCWRRAGSPGNMASAISPRPKSPMPGAIDLLLRRHEPFPAIVRDRRWNVMQANRAALRLMTMLLGEARMTRPLNHMRMFLAPDELRPYVVDWPDVAAALLARARHEAMAAPLDLALQSTWRELLKLPDIPTPQLNETETPGPLCEVRLRKGDVSIGLIGAVLTLGTPQDVTLQELRVEMFMPADEGSEALLAKLAR